MIRNPILGNLNDLTAVEYFQKLLPVLIIAGFITGSVIFFFSMLLGGIQWMTAAGDKGKVEMARGRITNAIIGLVVLFSLYAVISLIDVVFGVDLTLFNLADLKITV